MDIPYKFYGGTSGLKLPIPKRDFPPELADKSRIYYCSIILNSLEVNSSFYKAPLASTVNKWANDVAGDFKFTFKLWRDITHNKGLEFKNEDVQKFMNVIRIPPERMGCLLIQFPPGSTIVNREQLELLLNTIKVNDENNWPIALEFRHKSWYRDDVYELIEKHEATMVIHDMPASASPLDPFNNKLVYLRFHGPEGDYKGSYSDDFLAEYASYIYDWQKEGKTVYAYFNNTMGNALQNLMTLKLFVRGYIES